MGFRTIAVVSWQIPQKKREQVMSDQQELKRPKELTVG